MMVNLHSEDDRIAQFMETVREALASDRSFAPDLTEEMVSEMRCHILALYDAYLEVGYSSEEAVTLTLAKFGTADRAVGRRTTRKISRPAIVTMLHAVVGIVSFAVAPMTLENPSGDFSLAPMILGGLAGFFISQLAIRSKTRATHFAMKVAAATSLGYLGYGLLMVSQSGMQPQECLLRVAILAPTFLILGFVLRWSWLEQNKSTAIAR
jgi:hypothetical protein